MKITLFFLKTKITLVVLCVAMIAGAIGTVWMVDQSDHEKRSDLVSQARLVAHSFHDDPIKYLSGTESDLDSPNYQHIKQILISTRSVNTQYRFIYLMGRKSDNKTIFFFADSEPIDSPDFSPPGQTYAEASDVIQSIFDKKNAAVEGPVSDQWGTWFSAYAPLIGPVSGEVIAVIGIDIAAGDWYWDIASQSALPVGLLLGFLLVFSYILLYRLNKTVDDQQTKLLESEKRFRTMFQENRAIMLLIEPESGKILDANGAASQFYGFSIKQLKSMSMDEINTMDPAQTSIARASVLNKEKNHFYFQHKLASGEIRDIESYTTPINTGGEIVLFSILHDNTDRKRIEQRYRELVEQIPEVIYTDEIGGDWQFISPNIEALCGYTAEELIADADLWMNNIPTEDQIRIQAEIRSLSIGDILGIDFRFQTRNRGMIWIRDHGVVKEDRATGKKLIQGLLADITEQKKVEEALQKLYENLGRSQSIAHVGNWSLNLSNNSFGASEEGFRLLGFPPEANTTFDEVTALIHNNDRQRVREVMMKAIQIGSPYQVEMRIAKKDTGEFRHLLSIGEIEQDAEGRSIQVFGINQDITERKQIEEELAGEKQRLANIIRGTDIGTWAWNIQTNEEVVNERYAEILGYTLEELAPISADIWEKYAHPDDFKKTEALLEKHFNGVLDSYENEVRMRHKSGRWVWVLDKGKVITWTEDGKPWMMFGTHQDITGRKQMEEALRENETRLRAITDSAHDAILMMDPQGLVSYWNLAAERILGFTSAEAIGQTLHELIVPEHYHAAHHAAFPTFQRTGQGAAVGKTIEVDGRRKDGSIIAIQLSLSSLFLNGGWYAVGIISDITERKRMQEALQTTLIDLEQTNQSLVDQTLRANEMTVAAEYANAAKSEFLANMSHEIRTPMNGVIGMTGLLLDTDLTPEQRQFTNIIRSSSETLLSLINDILDFSKIEAKKMDLESIDFDLRLTLEDTMEMLSVKAHEKGLEIAGILDPDIPAYVRGDPGRVRQIITNLGNNAIKFTPRGEISLRANLESQDEKQVCVRFAITDTGIGIPQDKMARLFTPFSQVDGSVTRKYGGTGLGLAISKQLAELMGGSTGVTSEEGIGSTFWFTVVFEKTSDEKIRNLVPLANLTGIKVLVVDDHEVNRLLVSLLLKSWGCRYAEAEKGDVALSLLQEAASSGDPYQAALLDMQMPDMDGAELARRIKADPRLGATQLILFTSLGKRGDAAQMKALGFSGYLTKPLRQEQLHECLALVLGQATISTTQNTHQTAPTELVTRHTIADSFKHKTHILLAEDNTINQFVVTKILKKLGYRADVVANGQEAITALQTINYDLILMDCQMPEMDGFEATRLIRDPQTGVLNPLVPIVALTANALTGDRERCLKAGMDDYLSKPINVDDLNVALEKWLAKAEDEKAADDQTQSQRISETDSTTSNEPQAGEGDETSIFNEAELVQRLMDDLDLVEAVVIAFVEDMPQQITALKQFLASGDISGAQRQAHTIKGASANLGASRLRQVAFELEKLAKNSDIPEAEIVSNISKRMPEIETAFEQLKQVLKRIYSI